jgi:hypothetical protein
MISSDSSVLLDVLEGHEVQDQRPRNLRVFPLIKTAVGQASAGVEFTNVLCQRSEHGRTSPAVGGDGAVMVARRRRLLADDVDESKHPVVEEVAAIIRRSGRRSSPSSSSVLLEASSL